MSKRYEVVFSAMARPGAAAIGTIRRGQRVRVDAAEAVRLVDVKGLAFASAKEEAAARRELTPHPPEATAAPGPNEEH